MNFDEKIKYQILPEQVQLQTHPSFIANKPTQSLGKLPRRGNAPGVIRKKEQSIASIHQS